MEVVITMLITAIVIGITYSAYSIISQSYLSFQKKNDGLAVLSRVDQLLTKDFSSAVTICKTQNGLFIKNKADSISYEFQPEFIVRTSTVIDTFKVQNGGLNTFFENQPVVEINPVAEQNRIDEMSITVSYENEKIPYHYRKQYSSADLLERNPNALN